MDPIHDRGSMDPVHESGPWTRSKVGVHGPLVHVLSSPIWGAIMRNHYIVFFSDNHAVVDIINKQTSREPKIMVLVRRLVLNCLKYSILFKSKHIRTRHFKPRM